MYEASQHTIITRKPVFPSSAGVCTTVSTVGSSPQNCQIGPEHPKREMEAGKLGREAGKQGNPITIRPGSLTPVELTPPPSAATTRAASLSKYSHLDLSVLFYGGYLPQRGTVQREKNAYTFEKFSKTGSVFILLRKISKGSLFLLQELP